MIKSLWASVQGDPVFMRRVNGWLTIFWILMIPVSIVLGLLSSVAYVSALSLWALVSGHWSAWQAARVEVQQQAEAKALEDDPIEERVVEHLIKHTDISPTPTPTPTFDTADPGVPAPQRSSGDVRQRLRDIAAQLGELQLQIDEDSSRR